MRIRNGRFATPSLKSAGGRTSGRGSDGLSKKSVERLSCYKLADYISDVESDGLEKTWDRICRFAVAHKDSTPEFLDVKNFGELYEIGLAVQDKTLKKKSGQYYTPDDVAAVMCGWLQRCGGTAVCDVACGTGKLILTYLDSIGFDRARELISSGNLYLYDFDHVALKICRTIIAVKYGPDTADSVNGICCDFLDESVRLPENCKVISNPPYARADMIRSDWDRSDVLLHTRELYSAFMEKIFGQSAASVVISPFSFISAAKFYPLRKEMCRCGNGFIVAFDNIPGTIFCGRKHGIFNTNTANSVRAAVTVLHRSSEESGFRVSPLIRFKNRERNSVLKCDVLEKTLPDRRQLVGGRNTMFAKVGRKHYGIFEAWTEKSRFVVRDFISGDGAGRLIDMPNTCRYYTTASGRKLSRTGSITVHVADKDRHSFLYCMINSSFAYWWWRIYDGGITYPINLFYSMPVPFNLLDDSDRKFFALTAKKMMAEEDRFIVTKMNAGGLQENIKFPEQYRNKINRKLLSVLGFDEDGSIFDDIHANHFAWTET